jgi:hypothetical protein
MLTNSNILFSLKAKDALNRLGLHRCWAHARNLERTIRTDLKKMDYGDSRVIAVLELKKVFYEGLTIGRF